MSKHTPGPWWVVGDMPGEPQTYFPSIKAFVDGTRAVCICRAGSNNLYKSGRDWDNARLIAAAPDLLNALQALFMDCMVHDYEDAFNTSELATTVRAAIAKATRETA